MTFAGLLTMLNASKLNLVWDADRKLISVGRYGIANPIIWFNPRQPEEDYSGTVQIKAINAPLFTDRQIREALLTVDTFLKTPLKERELYF